MRIMARLVGGPLDGQVFSVDEDQDTIEGMGGMDEGDSYVSGQDLGMSKVLKREAKALFNHPVDSVYEFDFKAAE